MKISITILFIISTMVLFNSCQDDAPAPDVTSGTITLRTQHFTTVFSKNSGTAAFDSMKITRARLCLRNIKFKSITEDSLNFKTTPILVVLDTILTSQSVGAIEVPLGTYKRIEFDIHRLQKSSLAVPADTVTFADFLKGERYSVIVEGHAYFGSKDSLFTYRSKIDVKQKLDLTPNLVVDKQTANVTATMQISTANWFKYNGVPINPLDTNNTQKIDDAIMASIRMK